MAQKGFREQENRHRIVGHGADTKISYTLNFKRFLPSHSAISVPPSYNGQGFMATSGKAKKTKPSAPSPSFNVPLKPPKVEKIEDVNTLLKKIVNEIEHGIEHGEFERLLEDTYIALMYYANKEDLTKEEWESYKNALHNYRILRALYKIPDVYGDLRENIINRAKATIRYFTEGLDYKLNVTDFIMFNGIDFNIMQNPITGEIEIQIPLRYRDENGNEYTKLINAPTTAFNYLIDIGYEHKLKSLINQHSFAKMNYEIFKEEFENNPELYETYEEEFEVIKEALGELKQNNQTNKKEIEDLESIIRMMEQIYKAIKENKMIDIYEIIFKSSNIQNERPERGVALYEGYYTGLLEGLINSGKGIKAKENDIMTVTRGMVLHELGHSLYTFDIPELYPEEAQEKFEGNPSLRILWNNLINISEDGRLTRFLLKAAENSGNKSSYERALLRMAYVVHTTKYGASPMARIYKEYIDPENPIKSFAFDFTVPLSIMTMLAHFNISLDQKDLYDFMYPLLEDGFEKEVKSNKKFLKEVEKEYMEDHPNQKKKPSYDELKKWKIDKMIKLTPLWRFFFEKDTKGKTGYDYIQECFEAKTTISSYDPLWKLMKRLLVVYGMAKQKTPPPQQGAGGNASPMQQEGQQQSSGQSQQEGQGGEGTGSGSGSSNMGEREQEQQTGGGGGAGGKQEQKAEKQTGGKNGKGSKGKEKTEKATGSEEGGEEGKSEQEGTQEGLGKKGTGKNIPINPDSDIDIDNLPTSEVNTSGTITMPMPDVNNDVEGNSMGMGASEDAEGSTNAPKGGNKPETDEDDEVTKNQKQATKLGEKASNKAKEKAKENLNNSIKEKTKNGGFGETDMENDIMKGDDPTKDAFGNKLKNKKGGSLIDNIKDAVAQASKYGNHIKAQVSKELRKADERLLMADEVLPEKGARPLFVPTDRDVMLIANSFYKLIDRDIEKAFTEIEEGQKRRGRKLISTRLASVLTSPRTAKPFVATSVIKDVIPPLNIFVLIDISGSMGDEDIKNEIKVVKGIYLAMKKLKKKYGQNFRINFVPMAFGTGVNYRGKYLTTVGIKPNADTYYIIKGGTPLGNALTYISNQKMKDNTIKQFKGRIYPKATDVVLVLTDGEPTDNIETPLEELKKRRSIVMVAGIEIPLSNTRVANVVDKKLILDNVPKSQIGQFIKNNVRTILNREIKRRVRQMVY